MSSTIQLLSTTLTTAVTASTGSTIPVQDPIRSLALQAALTYGSGGTTAKAWVQTSYDNGASWMDIASFAFTTSTATRLYNLTDAVVTSIATPGDGALADNTAVNGFLGPIYRVKLTTTGTYAGGTTFVITGHAK